MTHHNENIDKWSPCLEWGTIHIKLGRRIMTKKHQRKSSYENAKRIISLGE